MFKQHIFEMMAWMPWHGHGDVRNLLNFHSLNPQKNYSKVKYKNKY